MPEFEKYAFAYNREPNFFDISRVKRPADRIAHYLEYKFGNDELQKAASSNIIIPGVEWAQYEGVRFNEFPTRYQDLIGKLVEHENLFNKCASAGSTSPTIDYINNVLPNVVGYEATADEIKSMSRLNPGTLFYKLKKSASVLPYYSFLSYVTDKSISELQADSEVSRGKEQLAFGYTNLQKQGSNDDLEELIEMFNPGDSLCEIADPCSTDAIDQVMEKLTEKFSCKIEPVRKRVVVTIIKAGSTKNREFSVPKTEQLNKYATTYLAYQLNAMFNIAKSNNLCDTNEVNTDLAYAVALNRFS
jgi:hypothetical protein